MIKIGLIQMYCEKAAMTDNLARFSAEKEAQAKAPIPQGVTD